jgi:hypothetical protein
MAEKVKQKKLIPAAELFGASLKAIDEFVTRESNGNRKRGRDSGDCEDDGISVAAAAALEQLTGLIAQHRLAAMPSVETVAKRLSLLLCSASGGCEEAWECAELCCSLYGAGMARLVQQLLEHLCTGDDIGLSEGNMERLSAILRATGQYVPSPLLQQFSHRVCSWSRDTSCGFIDLAEALLCVCSPLPTQLFVRCVELISRSWGSTADLQLLRAMHRLKVTLSVLRHPTALPFFIPSADSVELPIPAQPNSVLPRPSLETPSTTALTPAPAASEQRSPRTMAVPQSAPTAASKKERTPQLGPTAAPSAAQGRAKPAAASVTVQQPVRRTGFAIPDIVID